MPDSNLPSSDIAIINVLKIMGPLVSWLLKSGVGYSEFSHALKSVFYHEAEKELEYLQQKKTDSSISLLSGLNRREVYSFKQRSPEQANNTHSPPSVPARIVTLWIQKKWHKQIAFSGEDISFETLAKEISQDKHPRAMLQELQRLGLVTELANTVILHTESFTPSNSLSDSQKLLSQSAFDHLSCGISNIFISKNEYLEQNLQADELTEESLRELKEYSNQLWQEYTQKMLSKALECTQRDEGKVDACHRFSLGIYQYDEPVHIPKK